MTTNSRDKLLGFILLMLVIAAIYFAFTTDQQNRAPYLERLEAEQEQYEQKVIEEN